MAKSATRAAGRAPAVPKAMQPRFDEVVALTDAFCHGRLNAEYARLAQAMAAALSRKRPSPLSAGQPKTWACGIVHLLGQLNFLSDKASEPCMTLAELADGFGVGQSTGTSKAKLIADLLHATRADPTWMLRSVADRNPMVWMVMVNGMVADARNLPHDLQVLAYEKGIIPYVPEA